MRFSRFFIDRPIFAVVLSLVILISSDGRLLVRQFGASPEGAAAMREAIEKALSAAETEVSTGEVRRAST